MRGFVGKERAAFVRKLLNLLVGLLVAYSSVLWVSGAVSPGQLVSLGVLGVALVALRAGMAWVGTELAGALVVGLVVAGELRFLLESGLGPVAVADHALIMLLSSVLFGRRGIIFALVASSALVVGGAFVVPTVPPHPVAEWVTVTVIFALMGIVAWWWLAAEGEARVAAVRSAEALFEQEIRYAELVRAAPDGVLSIRPDGRVDSMSPAVARMTGYQESELLGRRLWELPLWAEPAQDVLRGGFRRILAGQPVNGAVIEVRTRGGGSAWFEVLARLVRRSDGALSVHATLRDVSDRERAQRARVAYEQGLQHAERVELVGRLAGGVAHDFNNLLAVITTNAELMASRDDAVADEELDDLRAAAALGADLTRKLMSLAQNQRVEVESLDVGAVLAAVRPVLRSALPSSVDLAILVHDDVPAVAAGHAHLEQALVNLVVNARDAMPEGGQVTIDAHAALPPGHAIGSAAWARIDVRDSGVGIAPEHRALVFEPFFTTKGSKGTGLGLASVLGIVEQIGGYIDLTSQVGEGTTFTLYLPPSGTSAASPAPVGASPQNAQCQGGTVLLVEDGDAVRRATRRCLQHLGYQVVPVASVPGALAALERERPDLVLSDVVMPYRSGVELMRELHQHHPEIPVVLMSAHVSVPGASEADAFLQKPFTLDGVAEALEQGRVEAQHRLERDAGV